MKILKQYMIKKDYLVNHNIYLKDKNILISDGIQGTKLWDLKNLKCIKYFDETLCIDWYLIFKLNDDIIIVNHEDGHSLFFISLSKKEITNWWILL